MATATFYSDDDRIPYTPGSAVASGDVVVLSGGSAGKLIGIATDPIAANETKSLVIRGIFRMPGKSGDAFAAGEKVYWDAANKYATLTSSGNTLLGLAVEAKGSSATTCKIKLGHNAS